MMRFAVVFGLLVLGACNKPSEESCRQAVANMRRILGTEALASDDGSDIRRCKGGSKKESVECAIKATTRAELEKCGFVKPPDATGSAAGSAAAGSAAAGSAAK